MTVNMHIFDYLTDRTHLKAPRKKDGQFGPVRAAYRPIKIQRVPRTVCVTHGAYGNAIGVVNGSEYDEQKLLQRAYITNM